jgi:hypothetical protein
VAKVANDSSTDKKRKSDEFSEQAAMGQSGVVGEFFGYLRQNKKWWLTPIVVVLLLVGALIVLGGTAAAPFIYTLF